MRQHLPRPEKGTFMNALESGSTESNPLTHEISPLSVLYAEDIITLDAALFSCTVRSLPLNLLGISVFLVEITPEVATALLLRKNTNRSMRLSQLRRLKRAIEKSRWQINGETIIFDHQGRLVEGQHRLQAVIDLQQTIWTLVVHGIDFGRFKTMGQGAKRTAGDILGIQGVKNATNIAAALRWVYRYETGQMLNPHPDVTDDELTDTLPEHADILQSIPFGKKCQGIAAPGLATALHYLFRKGPQPDKEVKARGRGRTVAKETWDKGDPQRRKGRADHFFWSLATGENLEPGDPILVVRNRILQPRRPTRARLILRDEAKAPMIINTWNLVVTAPDDAPAKLKDASRVAWHGRVGQKFPEIL
jgi:hypothetical protein